ncbi:NAD(P)-dependent alcohol dehydrogenase [Paraliomyxa miuraensis]|uniref:NAD(P)-dependent alcohol dehydrogenase n=1 Tax=Paraliomyxa miuraensis TaxID=376150 RepID=UPI002259B33D|nr:NAD(P)-dependent alcohol dehydrogenase [Paraliomyxa miuraensis]MCX4241547.1 NAD(P)-dependent alcohol dehydrogenase [Paraliomyxa miuraensis]
MRAAVISQYGRPEALEIREVDKPTPGPRQLLVRVRASSVNPVDCAIRSGALRSFIRLRLPTPLGVDFAGVVEGVGREVEGFAVGDEVFGFIDIRVCGAHAEYAVIDAAAAAKKPASLSWEEAGASPGSGLTAQQALTSVVAVRPGERVLINGAGGGVGTFAVQIAKALGCHVTAVGSTSKRELLLSLGADEVIDYTKQDPFAARAAYDVIIDCVGNIGVFAARRLLVAGGRCVEVASNPKIMLRALLSKLLPSKPYKSMYVVPRGSDVEALAGWFERNEVRVVLDRTYPLEKIAEAHAYVERGRSTGKVAISIAA